MKTSAEAFIERKQPLWNDFRALEGCVHSGGHPRNIMLSGELFQRTPTYGS